MVPRKTGKRRVTKECSRDGIACSLTHFSVFSQISNLGCIEFLNRERRFDSSRGHGSDLRRFAVAVWLLVRDERDLNVDRARLRGGMRSATAGCRVMLEWVSHAPHGIDRLGLSARRKPGRLSCPPGARDGQ